MGLRNEIFFSESGVGYFFFFVNITHLSKHTEWHNYCDVIKKFLMSGWMSVLFGTFMYKRNPRTLLGKPRIGRIYTQDSNWLITSIGYIDMID